MKATERSKQRPTVDALCARHRNEERHTRHVAALAARLFDATRGWLRLRREDRPLLVAAARLHDIGFAQAPRDHIETGVALVRDAGLRGWPRPRVDDLLGVMLLHGGRPEGLAGHPVLTSLRDLDRVQRLGALLRVADALDHSHLQDSRIVRVEREASMIRLHVTQAPFSRNLERAMAKSDLWQQVFPLGLVLQPHPSPRHRLVRSADPAADAVRKLLLVQHRVLRDSVRRAARSEDDEALHDLRIALRCVRRLLEAFPRAMRDTSAAAVDHALRRLARHLGPARDLDVWIELLARPRLRRALGDDRAGAAYLRDQERARVAAQRAVREQLGSEAAEDLLARLGYLVRIELAGGDADTQPFGDLARRRVRRAFREALALRALARSKDADDLHRLRIEIRKARLLASLVEPLLGPGREVLIRELRVVERRLGRLHDLDVALERARRRRDGAPAPVLRALRKLRRRQRERFREEWPRFLAPSVQRACRRAWS